MSTKVIIAAPKPGHCPISVTVERLDTMAGAWFRDTTIETEFVEIGGCSKEYVVYQGCRLVVEEITS